jgi:hypothetical protein
MYVQVREKRRQSAYGTRDGWKWKMHIIFTRATYSFEKGGDGGEFLALLGFNVVVINI